MRKLLLAAGACLTVSLGAGQAQAGIYTDDLTRCLLKSSSTQDRTDFVVFVFAAMSTHPATQSYSRMSDAERDAIARKTTRLMERLLLTDCRKETVAAIKYEREASISKAFATLGETAMTDISSHPNVDAYFSKLGESIDQSKWDKLAEEAK